MLVTPVLESRAATNLVKMGNYWFAPTNLTINAGDTVMWTNTISTAHDTTSATNLWTSPTLGLRATYAFTFTNAGYYPYACILRVAAYPQQTGSVTVVSFGNLAPFVAITNPLAGAVLTAPASFTVQAAASDSDGSVSQVEFFQGTTSIGVDTTSPYAAAVSSLAAGNYTFSAVASDNLGLKSTNSISVRVNSPPTAVTLVAPAVIGSTFKFSVATEAGHSYTAQFSSTLDPASWQTLTNFSGNGSVITVSDSVTGAGQRWYRVAAQ